MTREDLIGYTKLTDYDGLHRKTVQSPLPRPRPPHRHRHGPQLVPKWHDLAPGVQHDTALEDGRLGLLQMAQTFEVLALYRGAGLDFDAGDLAQTDELRP